MINPLTLIREALEGLPYLAPDGADRFVHVGAVPGRLPTDSSGHIRPYVVIWPGPGIPLEGEEYLSGERGTDGGEAALQTSLVASDIELQLLPMLRDVTETLTDLPTEVGIVKADIDQQRSAPILPDPDEVPLRHFIPLRWTAHI